MTVAEDSYCSQDPDFEAVLTAQIPAAQRGTMETADLVVEVQVDDRGSVLHGTIRVLDRALGSEAGVRELDLAVADCPTTAKALGLVLGVLIEAGRGAFAPIALEAPKAAPPPAAPSQTPAPPPSPPPPTPSKIRTLYEWRRPRFGHDVFLGAGGGYGLLPEVYAGATLGWGVRFRDAFPVWLELTGFPYKSTASERAQVAAFYGSLFPCPLTGERWGLRARVCPGFSVGALWAQGRGFFAERAHTQMLALAGLELGLELAIAGPLVVALVTRVEVPLLRERFIYYSEDGGTPELHESRAVTVGAFLGPGLRFR